MLIQCMSLLIGFWLGFGFRGCNSILVYDRLEDRCTCHALIVCYDIMNFYEKLILWYGFTI